MKCKCRKCGHEWQARTEKPRSCPNCKSYHWGDSRKLPEPKEEVKIRKVF